MPETKLEEIVRLVSEVVEANKRLRRQNKQLRATVAARAETIFETRAALRVEQQLVRDLRTRLRAYANKKTTFDNDSETVTMVVTADGRTFDLPPGDEQTIRGIPTRIEAKNG